MSDLRYLHHGHTHHRHKDELFPLSPAGWVDTFSGWIDADAPGLKWAKELPKCERHPTPSQSPKETA